MRNITRHVLHSQLPSLPEKKRVSNKLRVSPEKVLFKRKECSNKRMVTKVLTDMMPDMI